MKKLLSILCVLAVLLSIFTAFAAQDESAGPEGAVQVDNVNDLLAAIAPNTVIRLAPGEYNLTEAQSYGKTGSDYYHWEDLGCGQYALYIEGADKLSITGAGASIVTEPRWADVLRFTHCYGLTLSGLTLGHTEAVEQCEGGVLYLDRCDNAIIEDCSFYGCGTIGIQLYDCYNTLSRNSDIYHCTSAGVYASDCKKLRFENTGIHDFSAEGSSIRPWAAFAFYSCEDTLFDGCEVYSLECEYLFTGFFDDKVSFNDLTVRDVKADTAFNVNGRLDIDGLTMEANHFNRWFNYDFESSVVINGQLPDEEKLNERYPNELISLELEDVTAERALISYADCTEVHVSTADEFLSALGNNVHIIIDAEEIDLTTASGYGTGAIEFYDVPTANLFGGRPCFIWQEVYDGCALWIGNYSNLHISGGSVVTQPRYANVLNFYNCSNSSISGVTVGHSPEPGSCIGGVLNLAYCFDFTVDSCDLYGCGTYGIEACGAERLTVQDTYIHDCSVGAATLDSCTDVVFINMKTEHCPSYAYSFYCCTNLVWNDKLLEGTCSFDNGPSRG